MEKDISPKEIKFENLLEYGCFRASEFYRKVNKYIEKHGFDRRVKRLQDAIIDTCDIEYIDGFAREVKGANIQKLGDAIIKSGNAEYIAKVENDIREELRRLDKKEKQIAGEKPTKSDDENA